MKKKILIIVDLQNDFCPGGALAVPDGDKTVPVILDLIQNGKYDLVVASRDWHPANHGSFAANHPGKQVYDMGELSGHPQKMWPTHCVENTWGAEFHPDLKNSLIFQEQVASIISKGMDPAVDSNSAFFDNQHKGETRLRTYLEEYAQIHDVDSRELELHFVGLALEYCVKDSVMHARELGYHSLLVLDGTRAVNLSAGDDVAALREMSAAGVEILSSSDLLSKSRRLQPGREQQVALHP